MIHITYSKEANIYTQTTARDERNMTVDQERILDCTGLYCPEPVFRVRLELDEMESGQIVKVMADDPAAEEDIKRLVKRLGHEILEVKAEDETIEFIIRKV
jgi:TusA-related sulfurtransferase